SDTAIVWRTANEMTAIRVLHRRIAVCDGYAKLFKTLCDYAGIRSEVITGYAKCYLERGDKFRTNHSWNAVQIDSTWRLLDVTWASGYINYADEYVQHQDDSYFMTEPQQFVRDHYPEDPRWTLMDQPPTLKEFDHTPFKCKSYIKYGIVSFSHSNGVINAYVGDTVHLELQVKDPERNKLISTDPFFDSTLMQQPAFAFLKPDQQFMNKAIYSYVVQSDSVQWLQVMYNEDVVMRYKLNILRKESNR
ncbi:MAG TPA: transglutaminase domain-containing protein, partial [Flavisolibacter sp.]|nr:transglutaminase domain-containing protein [Flavisolibacter sp.]